MIVTTGYYCEQPIILACDAKCSKAWGRNNRPHIYVGDKTQTIYPDKDDRLPDDDQVPNIDDFFYLTDDELGTAPIDPGTMEGEDSKPILPTERLNKWCCRECERSIMVDNIGVAVDFELPDFGKRRYSIKSSDPNNQGAAV